MSQTQSELLKLQTSTQSDQENNSHSNTELVQRHPVENTPFEIVGNPDYGYFITLGIYRLTSTKQTIKDCEKLIKNKDWEVITGIIGAILQAEHTQKQQDAIALKLNLENMDKQE
jgi:hypothetical protein